MCSILPYFKVLSVQDDPWNDPLSLALVKDNFNDQYYILQVINMCIF